MKKFTAEAFSSITKYQWSKYCERVIKTEDEYWKTNNIGKQKVENISFVVRDESDIDSSNETGESDINYDIDSTISNTLKFCKKSFYTGLES